MVWGFFFSVSSYVCLQAIECIFLLRLIVVALFQTQITGTEKFAKVIDFLRKQLHRETLVSCSL